MKQKGSNRQFLSTKRKLAGYSQQQAAAKLKVSSATIANWEKGTVKKIPEKYVEKMEKLYKFSAQDKADFKEFRADVDNTHNRKKKGKRGKNPKFKAGNKEMITTELVENMESTILKLKALLEISGGKPISMEIASPLL